MVKYEELSEDVKKLIKDAYESGYEDCEKMEPKDFDLFRRSLKENNKTKTN